MTLNIKELESELTNCKLGFATQSEKVEQLEQELEAVNLSEKGAWDKANEQLTKLTTLEAKLQEAEKVIEFYGEKKNYGSMGQIIQWTDTPIGINRTVDFGSRARTYLSKQKGGG